MSTTVKTSARAPVPPRCHTIPKTTRTTTSSASVAVTMGGHSPRARPRWRTIAPPAAPALKATSASVDRSAATTSP